MILDLLVVAVTIALITITTAGKKDLIFHLKRNSVTVGLLITLIQLMIFVTQLESARVETVIISEIVVYALVKFRPLLIGFLFKIVFSVFDDISKKNAGDRPCKNDEEKKSRFDYSVLSRREIEVVRLASKGYTNAQIAEELFISTETVKSHMNSIFEKLGISSRKELMDFNYPHINRN